MSCYKPLKAYRTPDGVVFQELGRHDIIGGIELPCGQCIGCRMRRASDWALRCMHEASQWEANCFVTLTYARDCLPPDGSLDHRDFQLFMKRLRRAVGHSVRFYMCGEYGPQTMRPHYHACLFNADFTDRLEGGKSKSGMPFYRSDQLNALWTHGDATVQDLCRETAGYCARYIMKKQLGDDAKYAYVSPDGVCLKEPYAAMSLKPGIGAAWFEKYGRDVFPFDYAIADGMKHQVPKYYDKLLTRMKRDDFDQDGIEHRRILKGRENAEDQTPERRRIREIVHTARVRDLTRGDL